MGSSTVMFEVRNQIASPDQQFKGVLFEDQNLRAALKECFFFFFFFFSRATDQQYGIRTFEDNSKLHGHTNKHACIVRRGTSRD